MTNFPYFFVFVFCRNRSHADVLVPQLFVRHKSSSLNDLAQMLELPVEEVLHGCLPAVLVHILPVFAASKMHSSEANVSVTQHDLANATSCYDSLVKILGKEVCRHCAGRLEFFCWGEGVRSI